MEKLKVSVIVPVYNVAEYLQDCVNSILSQTYQAYEVLLIDDGSTDSSGKLCDEYEERYDTIKVIHKKNGGLSSARNAGIEIASGDYIAFIDSDDMVHCDYLKCMATLAIDHEADLVACDILKGEKCCWDDSINSNKLDIRYGQDALDRMYENDVVVTVAWNKLYSVKFFKEYGLRFPEGKIHEDMFFTPQVLAYTQKMVISNKKLYFYRIRTGSIINSSFSTRNLDALEAIEFRLRFLDGRISDKIYPLEIESYIRKTIALYKMARSTDDTSYAQLLIELRKKTKYVLMNADWFRRISLKYKIRTILFALFGIAL